MFSSSDDTWSHLLYRISSMLHYQIAASMFYVLSWDLKQGTRSQFVWLLHYCTPFKLDSFLNLLKLCVVQFRMGFTEWCLPTLLFVLHCCLYPAIHVLLNLSSRKDLLYEHVQSPQLLVRVWIDSASSLSIFSSLSFSTMSPQGNW